METALYYTLSTVSQSLAGALGMLAAFLAIRVSSLDATVRSALDELERRRGIDLATRPVSGSVREALTGWRQRFEGTQGHDYDRQMLARAEHVQASRETLLRDATRAFVVSACVMGASLVGLAVSPWLGQSGWRAVPTFFVGIGGAILCLAWYGRIVTGALRD